MLIQPTKSITPGSSIAMGICEDDVTVENKTVVLDNFELVDGALINVKFTNTTSGSAPSTITLNVNNTGAHRVNVYDNANFSITRVSSSRLTAIFRNSYVGLFFYDSFHKYWMLLNYNYYVPTPVSDILTNTSPRDALSANQGKVLKGYIDDINTKLDGVETLLSNI